MRGGHTCTASFVSLVLVTLLGLYLILESFAGEKVEVENQLALARVEATKLISQLEAQLKEATQTQTRLQGELSAQRIVKDVEVTRLKMQLEGQAHTAADEKAKLLKDLGAAEARHSNLTKVFAAVKSQLNAKESEASALVQRAQKAEAKIGAQPVQVEVAWKDMEKVPVWVWWDFPGGVPTGYRLNMRTWMKHIPANKFELRLVNFSNIKQYIPDLPDSFFRLYPLAQSDFIRAAMLALHGGVYMDGDMLLRNDLDSVFKELFEDKVEVIPYLWEHQECRKSFSTNFMAGTKGNALSRGWLERIYKLMNSRCPKKLTNEDDDGMYEYFNHRGCCYLANGQPRRKCYVSFGEFGDRSAHSVMADLDSDKKRRRLRMSCISKWKGMAANASGSGGELLWKRLLPGPPDGYKGPIGTWDKVPKREQRAEMCWREGQLDLRCTQSGLYPVFFERHGYHLFNLNNNDLISGFKTEEELLESKSVIAELYRLALDGEQPDPRLSALRMPHRKVKDQDHARSKMWGDTQQYKMHWLRT